MDADKPRIKRAVVIGQRVGIALNTPEWATLNEGSMAEFVEVVMLPVINSIDHVHINVGNWPEAEQWYQRVLGFSRTKALEVWAVDGGPLTLENAEGTVHLALFESDAGPNSTIAFGASGEQFLAWRNHLEAAGLELRVKDHKLAWSMYFYDPFGNYHEITTYDHTVVTELFA